MTHKSIDFELEARVREYFLSKTGGGAMGALSVRDFFAGLAMTARIKELNYDYEWVAQEAYRFADAMIEARKLPGEIK